MSYLPYYMARRFGGLMALENIRVSLKEYHSNVPKCKHKRDIEICLEHAMDYILTAIEFQAKTEVSSVNDQDQESE
jgi:hypothetical protein